MRSLFTKPQAPVTSDAVIFNYQQPARARLVALGSGKKLWLVETYDPQHKVWVWQQETSDMEQAVDDARRLSLFPARKVS
ncbi:MULTISPECIES: hypothetical protein [Vogesella]|jgi:hypothetical protein|uniref:hypothetical protein n=1 Tax=Vogesella TaxID=57739 RepID=UPI001186E119|nr:MULTISPECIES: hypothetical protein [Vogesella]MEC5205612.1 hypothetical protein [Vogesella perlucida]UDM16143.1 hypothetical protein LCH97_12690 [Vogesella sp. XCS3]